MRYVLTAALLACMAAHAEASIIVAATDFDGRTVSGATASNLTWTTNGVANPGALTASHNLFNTTDAQNRFVVDRNLQTEGSWLLDVPLNVGGSPIQLKDVTLDAFIFNNSGNLQTFNRDLDLTFDLYQGATLVDSDTVLNIYPQNQGAASQPQGVSFDFSGNTLAANTSYTLRLTAFGQGFGNNAGIDNLSVHAIPEMASIVAWGVLLLGGMVQRRR